MEGPAPRQPQIALAARTASVDVRNETPGASPIGVVFGAKGLAEQTLFSLNASQQDAKRQHSKHDAHP
jgi:hypothetical protein